MKTKTKRYPFSLKRYGHDLQLRKNALLKEIYSEQDTPEIRAEYEELIKLLYSARDNDDGSGVTWLTGKEYGLAKIITFWADNLRSDMQKVNGGS